jgi:hypothetical protein
MTASFLVKLHRPVAYAIPRSAVSGLRPPCLRNGVTHPITGRAIENDGAPTGRGKFCLSLPSSYSPRSLSSSFSGRRSLSVPMGENIRPVPQLGRVAPLFVALLVYGQADPTAFAIALRSGRGTTVGQRPVPGSSQSSVSIDWIDFNPSSEPDVEHAPSTRTQRGLDSARRLQLWGLVREYRNLVHPACTA